MSDLNDYLHNGGVPRYRDLPDYWQGLVTNVKNTWQDAENLDGTHGYTSYIWIPEETYSVVVMKLAVFTEKFRAYSKTTLAGGGVVATSSETGNHSHSVSATTTAGATVGYAGKIITSSVQLYAHKSVDPSSSLEEFTAAKDTLSKAWTDQDHKHNVSGQTTDTKGKHYHTVDIPDHTHDIDFGIYEEDITGRTLSAQLYDPCCMTSEQY